MSRIERNNLASTNSEYHRGGGVMGVPMGKYSKHITSDGSGTTTIGPGAYPDDIVAWLIHVSGANPNADQKTVDHLRAFVNEMDARAVERHGYSDSEKEAAHKWVDVPLKGE